MNKKIQCGGFSIDNETLVEENGVLKVVGGGSGSGLPPYTFADNGKGLLLEPNGQTEQITITVIQEQSCSTSSHGEGNLTEGTFDFSLLSVGDEVSLTVDGVTEVVSVQSDATGVHIEYPDNRHIGFYANGEVSAGGAYDFTVSATAVATVSVVAPTWSAPSSVGGVLVVHLTTQDDGESFTADKTAGEIYSAAKNNMVQFIFDGSEINAQIMGFPCGVAVKDGTAFVFGGSCSAISSGVLGINSFFAMAESESDYPSGMITQGSITLPEN